MLLEAAERLVDQPLEAEAVLLAAQRFFAGSPQRSALIVLGGVAACLVIVFALCLKLSPAMATEQTRDTLKKELKQLGYSSEKIDEPSSNVAEVDRLIRTREQEILKKLRSLADQAQELTLIVDWDREIASRMEPEEELARLRELETEIREKSTKDEGAPGIGQISQGLSELRKLGEENEADEKIVEKLRNLASLQGTEIPLLGFSLEFLLGIVAATSAGVLVSVYWRIRELNFQSTVPTLLFLVSFLNGFVAIIVSIMLILGIKSQLIPIQIGSEQAQQEVGLYYLAFAFGWFERLAKDTFENVVKTRFAPEHAEFKDKLSSANAQ